VSAQGSALPGMTPQNSSASLQTIGESGGGGGGAWEAGRAALLPPPQEAMAKQQNSMLASWRTPDSLVPVMDQLVLQQ